MRSRFFLTVNTWLFDMDHYPTLSRLNNIVVQIFVWSKIRFASSYLKGLAAVWWYNVIATTPVANSSEDFNASVLKDFMPVDHTKRVRNISRKLWKSKSVFKVLSDLRNSFLTILRMQEDEKPDRNIEGLKSNVNVEVLRALTNNCNECAIVALNTDSTFWTANKSTSDRFVSVPNSSRCELTEISSMKFTHGNLTKAKKAQRRKSIETGARSVCHKVGCRPYKLLQHTKNVGIEDSTDNPDNLGAPDLGEE